MTTTLELAENHVRANHQTDAVDLELDEALVLEHRDILDGLAATAGIDKDDVGPNEAMQLLLALVADHPA